MNTTTLEVTAKSNLGLHFLPNDRLKITNAFKELRKEHGYSALMGIAICCPGCIDSDKIKLKENYVAFLRNDAPFFYSTKSNNLISIPKGERIYLKWQGDGQLIVNVLKKHGLNVEWNGTQEEAIMIVSSF